MWAQKRGRGAPPHYFARGKVKVTLLWECPFLTSDNTVMSPALSCLGVFLLQLLRKAAGGQPECFLVVIKILNRNRAPGTQFFSPSQNWSYPLLHSCPRTPLVSAGVERLQEARVQGHFVGVHSWLKDWTFQKERMFLSGDLKNRTMEKKGNWRESEKGVRWGFKVGSSLASGWPPRLLSRKG